MKEQTNEFNEKIEIGKSKIIKEGKKLAILNFGARLKETLKAAERLNKKGINVKDLITFDKIFIEQKSLDEITKRLT